MRLKKIFICIVMCLLFWLVAGVGETMTEIRITDIHYRCRIENANPLWHVLFFLFNSENREFFWREKNSISERSYYHEVEFFNKSCLVAKFISKNGNCEAMVNFGGEEWRGKLNPKQAKAWFEMQDFSRSAKPGDIYSAGYKTSKNDYKIFIEARNFDFIPVCGVLASVLYFEARVWKKSERFIDMKFWVARNGILKGQVVKGSFKRAFWPMFIIEAIEDQK